MKVFAISDPHLSFANPKPMDIFGQRWDDHFSKIQHHWRECVNDEDLVLIPGDISWAMKLDDAKMDLHEIGSLPGNKAILRGNHDYWWSSLAKIREILPEKMHAIQNDAIAFPGVIVCGTRGWICPGSQQFSKDDEKIYKRETMRLKLSLAAANAKRKNNETIITMMHFPPFNEKKEDNEFTEAFESNGASIVIYGHLHGNSCRSAFEGFRNGVEFRLTSCDHLGFKPQLILEL